MCHPDMQMTFFSNYRFMQVQRGTQIQRIKKGAPPAGRYTSRARRTNTLVVGQQDSGGRTDLVISCDRSYPEACLESDGSSLAVSVGSARNAPSTPRHQWDPNGRPNASLTSKRLVRGKVPPRDHFTRDGVEPWARFRRQSHVHIASSAFSAR